MSLIATGYTAQIAYKTEATYGSAPTATAYNWPGVVTEVKGNLDQKPIILWRLDGQSRFPAYVLQGPREVDLDVTYIPQDVNILTDMITNILTASHSYALNYTGISQGFTFTGLKANTIKIAGKAGDALRVTVNYWGQNITSGVPAGVTFPTDPGTTPFFFVNESVSINSTVAVRVLDFELNIENNLERVYQFGQPTLRVLPPKLGNATGTMNVTFADLTDFNNVLAMTRLPVSITLDTGSGHTLTLPQVTFTEIPEPAKPEDLVKMPLTFVSQNTAAGANAVQIS